jgi:VanZ family protein
MNLVKIIREKSVLILIVITLIMLIAGFWPFNFFPKNKVEWDQGGKGLILHKPALIASPELPALPKNFSMEFLIQPLSREDSGLARIASLCDSTGIEEIAFIGQWRTHLAIESGIRNSHPHKMGIMDALIPGRTILLTVTVGKGRTDLYINGVHKRNYPYTLQLPENSPLRILLGNSPEGKASWSGVFKGFSLYGRRLHGAEISEHYGRWIKGKPFQGSTERDLMLMYPFQERSGWIIGDIANERDIQIKKDFRPFKPVLLNPIKNDFSWKWNYWQDALVNVFGFAPFGFFTAVALMQSGYFSLFRVSALTAVAGTLFSFGIEYFQVYLPSRSSQMSDVICNLLGTILGIVLFICFIRHLKTLRTNFRRISDP